MWLIVTEAESDRPHLVNADQVLDVEQLSGDRATGVTCGLTLSGGKRLLVSDRLEDLASALGAKWVTPR